MAHRTFVDPLGETWEVWDVRPDMKPGQEGLSGVPAGGWLCFQSGSMRKRLMPIPAGWAAMPEVQLLRYWQLAAAVASRTGSRPSAEVAHAEASGTHARDPLDPRD